MPPTVFTTYKELFEGSKLCLLEKFLPVAVGGVPKLFIGKLKPPEFVGPEAEGQGTFGRENPIDLEASLLYRAAKSMGRRNKF